MRFLQYFKNLFNSFINILAILQDFNEIFSKYSLNSTVLCGYLNVTTNKLTDDLRIPFSISLISSTNFYKFIIKEHV